MNRTRGFRTAALAAVLVIASLNAGCGREEIPLAERSGKLDPPPPPAVKKTTKRAIPPIGKSSAGGAVEGAYQ
jgi:hypothetical protein